MNQSIPLELGTEKIGKLLRQYAIPAIIAMTASSLYNMVDAIFIGQGVGPYAISGLAITFPFMNLAAAFGTLVGVGAATLCSMLLGQRNYEMANKVLGNVVVLNFIIGISFTIFSLLFLNQILTFFGASENTLQYAKDYMVIILSGNIITHIYFGLNALLRSSGHPKTAMAATILTVVLNAILDPIFIFTFDMGIRGAAIATLLAQMASLIWLIFIFSDKHQILHFKRGIFCLQKKIVKDSLAIGLAPFLMNFIASFIVIFINMRLKTYGGDLAIGAYGIVNRVAFVFIMVVLGMTQGMQPIAGYNYGAKQMDRVILVLRSTLKYATLFMLIGFVICELFSKQVVSIFTQDEELLLKAAIGLRIVMMMSPIVGFQIVISNFFQSIGMPKKAIFMSLSRQLIFLLPCQIFLPLILGIEGVWYSFPISDLAATITAAIILYRFMKKINMKLI